MQSYIFNDCHFRALVFPKSFHVAQYHALAHSSNFEYERRSCWWDEDDDGGGGDPLYNIYIYMCWNWANEIATSVSEVT